MKTKEVGALISIGLFGIIWSVAAKPPNPPPGPPVFDVNVVNTPLPVDVANTPDVEVVNEPNVNVVNTPDVNVTNTTPIPVKTSNVYRFVGFSTTTFDGTIGHKFRHAACQADFGADARMCTTREILESPNITSFNSGEGWAHPVVVSEVFNATSGLTTIRDFSGSTTTTSSLSCNGWRSSASVLRGAVYVASGGVIFSFGCSANISVSCCAPQ